jgi:hypothetical protein
MGHRFLVVRCFASTTQVPATWDSAAGYLTKLLLLPID